MKITDFKELKQKMDLGMYVAVSIAHTKEYGCYKHYSAAVYQVEKITFYNIRLRNANFKTEYLELRKDNLESGQFYVEY